MKKADHQLVQRVLDGEVDQTDFEQFQQRMRGEPELGQLYGDYALLHHSLSEEFEGGHPVNPLEVDEVPAERKIARRLLIASLIVLFLTAAWWIRPHVSPNGDDDIAVAAFSLDAVWQIKGTSHNLGGATALSQGASLHLQQGRANVSLNPSVSAIIEGPAILTVLSETSLHLEHGKGYFKRGGSGGPLTVTTPKLTAVDAGTEFGIQSSPETDDEIHVAVGRVKVSSKKGGAESFLDAGDAARVAANGPIHSFPAELAPFAKALGRFSPVIEGPFDKARWRIAHGSPAVSPNRIEGVNYAAFLRLPDPVPTTRGSIWLATINVGHAAEGSFHTDGWAGLSFYSKGNEVVFFGDSFGSAASWSLDVKQRIPVIYPQNPITGEREVTMRYDARTGEVSLHEGNIPLIAPFCVGKIPAGTPFDEIRIGASSGAALAVKSLSVRRGEP
jgi:ferric-dicitrate binding protein FerR (iron transport regulator)